MNDMISLITIYLGLPLMSNSSHQDAKRRRDILAMVNLEDVPKNYIETRVLLKLTSTTKNTNATNNEENYCIFLTRQALLSKP